jgi:hypothetical protein
MKVIRIVKTIYGEWRMNVLYGLDATAYYASDLDDAIYTAYAEYGKDIEIRGSKKVLDEVKRIKEERKGA